MNTYTGSTRKEEFEKLKREYQRFRNIGLSRVVFLIGALITALIKAMLPSILCLAAMILFSLTVYRKYEKKYRQAVTDAVLTCSIGSRLDRFDLNTEGDPGFGRKEVLETKLLPVRRDAPENVGRFQCIRGISKGTEVSLCDTTLVLPSQDVLCGVWMHFVLPRDTGRHFCLLSRGLLTDSQRNEHFSALPSFKKQPSASAGLYDEPYIYEAETGSPVPSASDETAAVPASAGGFSLPASFTAAANRLTRKHAAVYAFSVAGQRADFFLKDRVLAPNYSTNTKPDERIMDFDPIPEFRDVMEMVKAL